MEWVLLEETLIEREGHHNTTHAQTQVARMWNHHVHGDRARQQMDTGPIAGQHERAAEPLVSVGDAHTERRPRQTRTRRGESGPTLAFLGGRHRRLGNIAAHANLRQEPRQKAPDLEISEGRAQPRGWRCHQHAYGHSCFKSFCPDQVCHRLLTSVTDAHSAQWLKKTIHDNKESDCSSW